MEISKDDRDFLVSLSLEDAAQAITKLARTEEGFIGLARVLVPTPWEFGISEDFDFCARRMSVCDVIDDRDPRVKDSSFIGLMRKISEVEARL